MDNDGAHQHETDAHVPEPRLAVGPLLVELALVGLLGIIAWRMQWLADDGYIYLTHVQNWIDNGAGPNLNPGERVEGYTSVAWLGLLALAGTVVPSRLWNLEQVTILVSIAVSLAAAAMWLPAERAAIATTRLGRPVARTDLEPVVEPVVVNVSLALFVSCYVVRSYTSSGLETPLVMWWVAAVVWAVWQPRHRLLVLAALAGTGPLVRPDLALVSAGLVGLVAVGWWRTGRLGDPVGAPRTAVLVALVAAPAVAGELVRVGYYGQLLPNTYYAKTGTGHGWSDGWRYLADAAGPNRWWWVLAAAVAATVIPIAVRARSRSEPDDVNGGERSVLLGPADRRRCWLLAFAVVTALATIRVGGDFMHGRTLLPSFVLVLGALAGAVSVVIDRLARPIAGRFAVGVTVIVLVVALQLPTVSRQARLDHAIVDGIADEYRFYERRNPNMHRFGAANVDPLVAQGRDLAALAERLDTEVGLALGPIGMASYHGQRANGRVYVYDVHGLTQPAVARVEPDPAGGTRVGHARRAPEPMVVAEPRVDFSSLSFEGYDEAFSVPVGSSTFVLINFDLLEPLRDTGLIGDAAVERMRTYLLDQLSDDADPDLVELLVWRPFPDRDVAARVAELHRAGPASPWAEWDAATARERATLAPSPCGSFVDCAQRAVEAHRAPPIEFLPPGALAPP